jgi:eukaryotic-like serine/threonine-protein kinase
MSIPQNRYEVLESLGTGATSRVDKARDTVIGRTVALKTLLRGFGSRDLQQQFLREAQIIGGLSHPNIVALFDVGTNSEGAPYFVMEYVEGKTLESFFDGGPLPIARAAVWAGDLASALGQAHRVNVIHGDVKPANILVTLDEKVKLGDFGIARLSTQVSGSGNLMGTPAYLSPEQILGNVQDSRSDLFSLGIVLYQMSTGQRPFDGDSVEAVCAQIISSAPLPPSHHNPSLPAEFDHVVMRCLSKNPDERFPTAEAFAASVYPFARNAGAAAAHSSSRTPRRPNVSWWNWPFGQKELSTVAAVLLVLISGASIVFSLRHPQPDRFCGHGRPPCRRRCHERPAFRNHDCCHKSYTV